MHAHIQDLSGRGVSRIFFPFVVRGPRDDGQNSYNCPLVSAYGEVIRNVQALDVPLDSPVFSMKDSALVKEQCVRYLVSLGMDPSGSRRAFAQAVDAQRVYVQELVREQEEILARHAPLTIILAGRPYHADPLIQHHVSEMIAGMGVPVITDDIVRDKSVETGAANFLSQWSYPNRILKAARWAAAQGRDVQFVELTSFGCGPDAFLTDAVRDILMQSGKNLTLLKLDDIDNTGSLKLRVRSLVESLRLSVPEARKKEGQSFRTTPPFTREDARRTILVPFFSPIISPLISAVFARQGYRIVHLPQSSRKTADLGLKYANNEVCYPATLVVGDILNALQSGRYDLSNTAVAMTQTGGQCRASNYIGLIKRALVKAGFGEIPVISFNFDSGIQNDQPGFRLRWVPLLKDAMHATLFADCLSRIYAATFIRETVPGESRRLKDHYLSLAAEAVERGEAGSLLDLLARAASSFEAICADRPAPKVGIVGEIFLKFNPFAHLNVTDWLQEKGIEVGPPILSDFFVQYFVNRKADIADGTERSGGFGWIYDRIYHLIRRNTARYNRAGSVFRRFEPLEDIFEKAQRARPIVRTSVQFGEGWLLPAEVATYYESGIHNVLSLQPFGCIANHIVARGTEKKMRQLFPDLNYLAMDFDGGVSEANIMNRLLLFVDSLR